MFIATTRRLDPRCPGLGNPGKRLNEQGKNELKVAEASFRPIGLASRSPRSLERERKGDRQKYWSTVGTYGLLTSGVVQRTGGLN